MRWDQIVVCYSLSPAWIAIRAAAFPVRHFHQKGPGGGCSASMIAATTNKKKVVVVGGGWAGFSAADALSKLDGVDVLVLDASKRGPGGLASGWSSPRLGMPVEGGIHGFWREYRNTFSIMESLGLELDEVLTPYTPSILVSEAGRVALAPVLGKEDDERSNSRKADRMKGIPSGLSLDLADTLPSPLDIALLSKFEMSSLSVTDRLSAIGLLGAWADFGQEDVASWSRYDGISADQLFQDVAGVTPRLYQQLVLPLLHVLPMTPGYDCSAAAALSCFHVFALQSKGAFDVRWCRGTISEKIFDPWSRQLRARNVTIQGSSRVTALRENTTNRILTVTINNQTEVQCDAIVLAIGTTAAKALVQSCPPLASIPLTAKWDDTTLRGVTCVAVRLFLYPQSAWVKDIRVAMSDSPVAVCGPRVGGISELTETGFCIYDLQRLQDYFGDMFQEGKCFTIEVSNGC
jgi:phytoene dehydrogenase-like protein